MNNETAEPIKELEDYTLLFSFKHRSFFGKDVNHYLYKGLFHNVHISYCDLGFRCSWVVSYGTGETLEDYEDMGEKYSGTSRHQAIESAKDVLGRVQGLN